MVRVFANSPGDLGSIPGRVIPMTQKMVLDVTLLKTQLYKARIKVKWSNPGKGVAPSRPPRCSSYRKGIPLGHPQQTNIYKQDLALNNIRVLISHKTQPTHTHTHIYIYMQRVTEREREGERDAHSHRLREREPKLDIKRKRGTKSKIWINKVFQKILYHLRFVGCFSKIDNIL